jgi:hypothetical protein
MRNVSVGHVERYLDGQKARGWALPTLAMTAYSLQKFFLHAEGRGWVQRRLSFGADLRHSPTRVFVKRTLLEGRATDVLALSRGPL